jgi:hypothetical protein
MQLQRNRAGEFASATTTATRTTTITRRQVHLAGSALQMSSFSRRPARNVAGLATEALVRAMQATLFAECCTVVGDLRGWWTWLRRRALHLTIYWAATHA